MNFNILRLIDSHYSDVLVEVVFEDFAEGQNVDTLRPDFEFVAKVGVKVGNSPFSWSLQSFPDFRTRLYIFTGGCLGVVEFDGFSSCLQLLEAASALLTEVVGYGESSSSGSRLSGLLIASLSNGIF